MGTLAQRYDPAYPIDGLLEHPDNPTMELEPAYVDVACTRWQGITGRLPVDAATGVEVDFAQVPAGAHVHQ